MGEEEMKRRESKGGNRIHSEEMKRNLEKRGRGWGEVSAVQSLQTLVV